MICPKCGSNNTDAIREDERLLTASGLLFLIGILFPPLIIISIIMWIVWALKSVSVNNYKCLDCGMYFK